MTLELEADYRPSDSEPFMNERQREYFRKKLLAWKDDILREARETLQNLQDENQNHPDIADRASSETDRARNRVCVRSAHLRATSGPPPPPPPGRWTSRRATSGCNE